MKDFEFNENSVPESDPSLRELEALLDRSATLDARSALDAGGNPRGRTLEDRVFSSTNEVIGGRSGVLATIGPSRGLANAWRIAAAIALVATVGVLYNVARQNSSPAPTTVAADLTTRTSSDVEFVLAAVSLLDEPLGSGMDELIADAARLRESVASDRNLVAEQQSADDKSGKQGV